MGYLSAAHFPSSMSTFTLDSLRNVGFLLLGGFISSIIYRLYFHPLAKYPGPLLGKLTDLYSVYHAYTGDRHLKLYELHEKHGPIARFGPNTLSFNTATALKAIYGHSAQARAVQKGPFYKAFPAVKGVHNTHNAISKLEHGRKRRVLSAAFSESALKGMEGLVLGNIEVMIDEVQKKQTVDMGEVFSWLTFDIMGELCFGRSFGMLRDQAQRFVTDLISTAAHYHSIIGSYLPLKTLNIGRVLFPSIVRDRWRFIEYSRSCANARMQMPEDAKKDFFYYLLHAVDPETNEKFSTKELWGEANVLMIAGSDTTATALSATLFYLSKNLDKLQRLKEEIRNAFSKEEDIVTGKELGDCHYLKACVDEAMRLAPPVPGLLPREVIAKDGVEIDGVFVPEGTIIGVPIYTIHHNPAYYPDPFAYKPERWLEDSTVEDARAAFAPFSIGPRGCIGKAVAYMELRISIARLMWRFEMEGVATPGKADLWGEGFAVKKGEYRLRDQFTSLKEGPVVKFWPREE